MNDFSRTPYFWCRTRVREVRTSNRRIIAPAEGSGCRITSPWGLFLRHHYCSSSSMTFRSWVLENFQTFENKIYSHHLTPPPPRYPLLVSGHAKAEVGNLDEGISRTAVYVLRASALGGIYASYTRTFYEIIYFIITHMYIYIYTRERIMV